MTRAHLILLGILLTVPLGVRAQERYRLAWGLHSGREHIFHQSIVIEHYYYKIKAPASADQLAQLIARVPPNLKQCYRKITASCQLKWSLPRIKQQQGFIYLYLQQGRVTFTHHNHVATWRARQHQASHPIPEEVRPYLSLVTGAFAVQMDFAKRQVLATWRYQCDPQGHAQQFRLGSDQEPDPLGIGAIYRQLPEQAVAVGSSWDRQRRVGPQTRRLHFTFSGLSTYQQRQVARLEISGMIEQPRSPMVMFYQGSLQGHYLLDYEREIMLLRDIRETDIKVYRPLQIRSYLRVQEVRRHLQIGLRHTNVP